MKSPTNSNPVSATPSGRGLSLWDRINLDPRYVQAKHEIRARYGLPLAIDIRFNRRKWSEWLNADEKRGQAFMQDVQALFKEFEVPDKWYADFIAEIAGPSSGEKNASI